MRNKGLGPTGMARIEAALLQFPEGIDSRDIAKMTGYARTSAQKGLSDLARIGRALFMRGRYGICTWYHVSFESAMQERKLANSQQLSSTTRSRLSQEERYARFLAFEDAPVHRIVPAHMAAPLRPAGPASVWGLAA